MTVNIKSLTEYRLGTRSNKGFSLVELMIALTISIVLIGAVILTYISSTAAARDAETLARMQENVRIASELLIRDIRNAGFRDETTLKVGHERDLRGNFATIDVDNSITVRYSGLGHCGQRFQTPRIVQNRYYIDGTDPDNPVLVCDGSFLPSDLDGNLADFIGSFVGTEETNGTAPVTVSLLGGVRSLSASRVCTNPVAVSPTCDCNFSVEDLDDACVGVEITLGLEGLDGDEKEFVLLAAFRNVILEKLNEPPPPPEN